MRLHWPDGVCGVWASGRRGIWLSRAKTSYCIGESICAFEMRAELNLAHGRLHLPVFLPDATYGVVRGLDPTDLHGCRVQALMMNAFHLMRRPGSSIIRRLGGVHRMFGWGGPIITDSGGFQAYSLIRQNPRLGRIADRGLIFRPEGSSRKINLTPEKSVRLQLAYGTDVVICLDDCTHVDDSLATQRESVARTIAWARRSKAEYVRRVGVRQDADKENEGQRPLIFAVIQGGGVPELRRQCAQELLEIGFDGFGLGGWPLDGQGNLLTDIIGYVRELVPPEYPLHALGVGHPAHIITCARMGYGLFDSSMPTRDARHGRLRIWEEGGLPTDPSESGWFSYLYVQDARHIRDDAPISSRCDCLCCSNYSRALMHHLFKMGDSLYYRLATIHNLRFVAQLMRRIRDERHE